MPKKRVTDSRKSYFTAQEAAELELDVEDLANADDIVMLFAEFGACIVLTAASQPGDPKVEEIWVDFAKKVIKFAKLTD